MERIRRGKKNYWEALRKQWDGWLSQYSDWLRAGRSEDRIPVRRDFPHLSRPDMGTHTACWTRGTGSWPGAKVGGACCSPLTPSCAAVKKEYSYNYSPYALYGVYRAIVPVQYSYISNTPIGRTACTEPQCLYSTAISLLPLWAVLLYRASVPVQYSYTFPPPMDRTACTEPQYLYSTAIPLLPLWTVQPVQSLSACTIQLYLYSPYVPYGLYRASVPVQYSYTSIPPMGRTACTEPQCLYSTAIPLLPLSAVRPVQSLSVCTVQLYLYSPYWPYGLYRASVPAQGCTVYLLYLIFNTDVYSIIYKIHIIGLKMTIKTRNVLPDQLRLTVIRSSNSTPLLCNWIGQCV